MLTALIDGDTIVYRVGFGSEGDPDWIAFSRADMIIDDILNVCDTDEYLVFLTPQGKEDNFRFSICEDYKAKRVQPKPKHYLALREYLISKHDALVAFGHEADDALGIAQTDSTILCANDKDLNQIPGKHYNFVKRVLYEVTEEEAVRFFYKQILMGDATDSIQGIFGIGPKKADKHLNPLSTEKEYLAKCVQLYRENYPDDWQERLLKAGQLLKIRRIPDEPLWQPELNDNVDSGAT